MGAGQLEGITTLLPESGGERWILLLGFFAIEAQQPLFGAVQIFK